MPGREGLAAKLGARLFDDEATRELYLSKIREKNGRLEAARLVGVAPSTVNRYQRDNPDFLLDIKEAEAGKVELAHKFWFDVMEDEEAPLKDRLKASELLERAFGRETKRDAQIIEHRHELVISGDQMDRVIAMQQKYSLDSGTIEGTVIEDHEKGTK